MNQRGFARTYLSGKNYEALPGSNSIGKLCQSFPVAAASVKKTGIGRDVKGRLTEPEMRFVQQMIHRFFLISSRNTSVQKDEHKRLQRQGFRSKPRQGIPASGAVP